MKMKETVTLDEKEVEEAILDYVRGRDPAPAANKSAWVVRLLIRTEEHGNQRDPDTHHFITAEVSREAK